MRFSIIRIVVLVCAILVSASCMSGVAMQSTFYGLYYGLEVVNTASKFVGDYKTMGVDLGPGVTKEEIFKIKKYAFIQPWSLKKNVTEENRSISDSFLERLIEEVRKESDDTIITEEGLISSSPALKEASDITAYIEAAHTIGLEAIITNSIRIRPEGYRIASFRFVVWDAVASGKKRLLATMRGEFKTPQSIDVATVSIANVFFKSAESRNSKDGKKE